MYLNFNENLLNSRSYMMLEVKKWTGLRKKLKNSRRIRAVKNEYLIINLLWLKVRYNVLTLNTAVVSWDKI